MAQFVFQSPGKYIQGQGVLAKLGEETQKLAKKPLLISDEMVWSITSGTIKESFNTVDIDFAYEEFNGEASEVEIDRLSEAGKNNDVDIVIGVGGGKTLDTSKAIADNLKTPVIIVPTTASTDAPTSSLSVIYSDEGEFTGYRFYDKNPDLIIVDSNVVVNAPIKLFASGMSDAMATLVEARATLNRKGETMVGGQPTLASIAIAEKCEETLFKHGHAAFQAASKGLVTPQVNAVIEANTLLSGLGFENGGLAAAHAIHNGFTTLSGDIHHLSHGEKVTYGTLVQLLLENSSDEKMFKYIDFYKSIGMPTTLKEMHLEDASFEDLVKVGKLAIDPNDTFANLSDKITAEDVANAILAVNELSNR
ncbi:glycerol dehydrogenase [Salinicoccus hispanicus]|uniref:Glycerol dehydrogenase n=1 Tax=Salinicoccus hispanicus TaxID=157225 RepID=A0A6N8U6B0_9STAP|nr:glycerol dehydrogenase [Salinicoccus hispanicus]MXQ52065.1 iron-containing alcohol dehydrogenase [Salinicoccus hispanicus]